MKKAFFLLLLNSMFFKVENIPQLQNTPKVISSSFVVSSGRNHSLLKTDKGEVFAWGTWGDINLNSDISTFSKIYPSDITSQIELLENDTIKSVSSGDQHSFILTDFGQVYCFGFDGQGQLGDGGDIYYVGDLNYSSQLKKEINNITNNFKLEINDKIIKVDGGSNFSIALTNSGKVFTFGQNDNGQLGINDQSVEYQTLPIEITSNFDLDVDDKIVDVSIGASHGMAMSMLGNVYVWGNNNFGQLGNQSQTNLIKPEKLDFGGEKVIDIACGSFHSYVLTNLNFLYGFGYNGYGQLADKSVIVHTGNNKNTPYEMSKNFNFDENEKIVDVVSGFFSGMVITSNNNIFSFGQNESGQLALRNNVSTSIPQKVNTSNLLSTQDYINQISLGEKHGFLVTGKGAVFSWGDNSFGQLGENYSISLVLGPYDITKNFPPIVKFSMIGSNVYQKKYEINVDAYYINNTKIDVFEYAWSHSNIEIPNTLWKQKLSNETIALEEGDGAYYLWVKVINQNEVEFIKVSQVFYLDNISPTLNVTKSNNYPIKSGEIVDGSVYVKAIDNNDKVCLYYKKDVQTEFTKIDVCEHLFNEDGIYQIKAVDSANNESQLFTFKIDTINPYIVSIDSNIISTCKYFTKKQNIKIKTNEEVIGYILNDNNYITALNENSDEFTIKLKKGTSTIRFVDTSGKISQEYQIKFQPTFLEDSELQLWVFGSIASLLVLVSVLVYTIRSKKHLKEGLDG